ncbi:glutamate dehydrogenase [Mesonia ostreae]|uniref:Glutamate dehydrogenase n=1 Tax=Mesonia ostreae TaxID=861110 RepID=A0ABU2KII1_9FLAO|nr:glutamate dehydrogenase [Mesonia ostreae]MDT0294520.1 glutamate dehydrogenase [Mesonia ostreae]
MKTIFLFFISSILFLCTTVNYGQGFSQEIGIVAGPVALKSDYGLRGNSETNYGNVGVGIGLVHYINFAYSASSNSYTSDKYFNNHFKIRTEFDYHTTSLDHYGKQAEKKTAEGLKLRSMHGKAKVIEIGPSIEYFPRSIREYESGYFKFAPYISLGVHYVNYSPQAETDLPGRIGSSANTFYEFVAPTGEEPYINTASGSTYAITFSAGSRYRLNDSSDLLLDLRWHVYGSDFIDGLDHDNVQNKSNDWMVWLNVGYVYYLNF